MPPKKAHQGLPPRAVAEPPPPTVAVPFWRRVSRPERSRPRGRADAKHPSEDGQPIAANTRQAYEMIDAAYPLRERYAGREDVFVGFDLNVYYGPGDETDRVVPDLFVALDVPSDLRDIYRISEEGKAPDWVLEVASQSTYKENVRGKKDLYESLGVVEYMVYDPEGDLHDPRLQGWVLRAGKYEKLRNLKRPGVEVALRSEVLGLEVHFVGDNLRFWDPSTAGYLLRINEALRRGDKEEAARKAAQEKLAGTEQKLEAAEEKLIAEARARREAEQRAEANARAMEEEIAALREELRRVR